MPGPIAPGRRREVPGREVQLPRREEVVPGYTPPAPTEPGRTPPVRVPPGRTPGEETQPGVTPQPRAHELTYPEPALLLPVRLETRFSERRGRSELLVRIYPDQIHIDTHEEGLTDEEREAGVLYWDTTWRAGSDDATTAQAAWSVLVIAYGAQRAAWIARSLEPTNVRDRPVAPTPEGSTPVPAPTYPTVASRTTSWDRVPLAMGLPSRWTVATYVDGRERHRVIGAPVRRPLAAGPDPAATVSATPEELQIDDGMRWAVDFDEAVRAGMAVRIPLEPSDLARGFDRVIAYGLADDGDGATLAALLQAQHYTQGLAFVPQGSATNNTDDGSAAYSESDVGGASSFAVEAGEALVLSDGLAAAEALGAPEATFAHVEHADRDDQRSARAATIALWPATGGYFLRQMMADVFTEDAIEAVRVFVRDTVRARGPVPAFRVGETPYGVLPATSLARWDGADAEDVERTIADVARRILPTWQESVAAVPHVGRGDPDEDLVELLGMDASAQSYRARYVLGEDFVANASAFLQLGAAALFLGELTQVYRSTFARLGYGSLEPRLMHLSMTEGTYPVTDPIVQDDPASESEGLATVTFADGTSGNYIDWLRSASYRDIRDERYPGGTAPRALLYKVLRQSVLLEYATLAEAAAIEVGTLTARPREPELVDFGTRTATGLRLLDQPIAGITSGTETIGQALDAVAIGAVGRFARLGELRLALSRLAALPTGELERLFTETLDLFSHRLDAWITALATARLGRQRAAGTTGVTLGGFGWVEDLRPRRDAAESAGYIHAPSLAQSAVAAVLRHGYLSHAGSAEQGLLALDLSSGRVRSALWLIDGVRQGQSLGALLGYRVETALHDRGLDEYVQPLRDRYPLVANKLSTSADPSRAAAPNVVDGLALHRDQAAGSLAWTGDLPATGADHDGIVRVLEDLSDVMDALSDLSVSESVFQILKGNTARAGGLLDALSRGERAPDPEVVVTTRAGIDVTHRLLLLFAEDPPRAASWPSTTHPRALAEPRLDAWLTRILPDPAAVRCLVTHASGEVVQTATVTLADLGLGPLDVLALADAADVPQRSELEQRIRYAAPASLPDDGTALQISFERGTDWTAADVSFPELLVAARAARDLIGGARALGPQDLIDPARQWDANGGAIDLTELAARGDAALASLDAVVDALDAATAAVDPSALRDGLLAASRYGATGAIPETRTAADDAAREELLAQAAAVSAELAERADGARALDLAFDRTTATDEELRDHFVDLLRQTFGRSFVALARVTAPDATTLADTFARSDALIDSDTAAPARWLQQLTHVRPGVARYDEARVVGQVLAGAEAPSLAIAQVPAEDPDRWLALPVPAGTTPTSGRVSLVAETVGTLSAASAISGLVLDEWTERIPDPTLTTGLAFHYDQPGAKAPQTLLLAVPPAPSERWDDDTLLAILGETLDLAKVRAVDLDTIGAIGQLIPGLYFAFNAAGATVSTGFLRTAPTLGAR